MFHTRICFIVLFYIAWRHGGSDYNKVLQCDDKNIERGILGVLDMSLYPSTNKEPYFML
jgi:hypothetical protein